MYHFVNYPLYSRITRSAMIQKSLLLSFPRSTARRYCVK